MRDSQVFSTNLAGREFTVEVNKLAQQANGAVLVRYGDTVVLVTATCSGKPREGIDFLPLTVDYEERMYSVGKIPGGFIKREGRPSEKAVLSARLIDRPLRPLFPEGFRHDVNVVATVMSVDQDNLPHMVALNGASLALGLSDIPFPEPVGAVTVGLVDGDLLVNPTLEQREQSTLQLVVAGTRNAIVMVEAEAGEVPEDTMLEALDLAHSRIKEIIAFQEGVIAPWQKEKMAAEPPETDLDLEAAVRSRLESQLAENVVHPDKQTREKQTERLEEDTVEELLPLFPEQEREIRTRVRGMVKAEVRRLIVEEGKRADLRALDEVRPIECETGYLPRVHGSGLFRRGQTQVLTALTLGAVSDEQILDGLGVEESKRFMHHYNFPPYCVGEARPIRGPSRREVGHGALVERALESVIPPEEEFPYTIRLISEVLESNGSSSMASVCAGSLALMDGGVPIGRPVAGIAMGLVTDGSRYRILTDIQGVEDALGDMDFKVAGTTRGVCALQLDSKVEGLPPEVLHQALEQAREARLHVLECMNAELAAARPDLSPYAPRIIIHQIDPEKIRDVIGPGGRVIRGIVEETGVKIDIEDDGKVFIASADEAAAQMALDKVRALTADVEVGAIYTGKVTRLMNFGAFVEFLPGKEGLVHISQLAPQRVEKVEDVVTAGDVIAVKVTEIDSQGRINLSRKQALPPEEQKAGRESVSSSGSDSKPRGSDSGRGRRGGPPRK